jgi:hypothetical protein
MKSDRARTIVVVLVLAAMLVAGLWIRLAVLDAKGHYGDALVDGRCDAASGGRNSPRRRLTPKNPQPGASPTTHLSSSEKYAPERAERRGQPAVSPRS